MQQRTVQDLLAERRANILEAMHETNSTAKEMLYAHVRYVIDPQIERLTGRKVSS